MKRHLSSIKRFVTTRTKLSIAILVIGVILGFTLWPKPPAAIETHTVKKSNITEKLSTSGTIISETAVDLTFSSPGKLVTLNARKGDVVEKGDVIATLDSRTVQKNMQSALRDYSKQRNTFEQTREDKNAKKPTDAVNDTAKRILENNQYDLEKAVISVELQDLARESSVLTTPIDGIVTRADVSSPGVNVGVTTTFTVADPTNLVFRIEVDEADIGKVQIGQEMKVILDAYPNRPLNLTTNTIDFATHKTETGGNAFYVEATLPPNDDLTHRIGMSGDGELVLSEAPNVLTVPLASIADEKYVYVKTQDGFVKREVKQGAASDTDIEIRAGLQEGDQVAIDPTLAEEQVKNKKKFGLF